jgi:hypothetical protein
MCRRVRRIHHTPSIYRVSFGLEHWDDTHAYVFKVQMVYDGQVAGRKTPSYPAESDDLHAVSKALLKVRKGAGSGARRQVTSTARSEKEPA